jgi:hypothetical protein
VIESGKADVRLDRNRSERRAAQLRRRGNLRSLEKRRSPCLGLGITPLCLLGLVRIASSVRKGRFVMAKLIYSTITSLEGYVADEDGNFDWAAPGPRQRRRRSRCIRSSTTSRGR